MIALNAVIGWVRLAITGLATVLALRFALLALGVEAFGVYIAAASLPLILSFLTGALLASTQRALATDVGSDRLGAAFNTSFLLHFMVALIILIVGEVFGLWFLESVLQVPHELERSARIALHLTVFAATIGALLVPYEALFQVHERFGLYAALDVARPLVMLVVSYGLMNYSGDRLTAYAATAAGSAALSAFIGALAASRVYPSSRLRLASLRKPRAIRGQLGVFSWTTLGGLAAVSRNQGYAVLMNVFFGPQGSAAFGVGSQLMGLLRQLATAITSAFSPRVLKMQSRSEAGAMIALSLASSKFSFFIAGAFAIPMIFEMRPLLTLWLPNAPALALIVAVLLILTELADQLSSGVSLAHLALGRIAQVQVTSALLMISSVGIALAVGAANGGPAAVLTVLVGVSIVMSFVRVVLLKHGSRGFVELWLRTSVLPAAAGLLPAVVTAVLITSVFPESNLRLLITFVLCGVSSLIAGYYNALSGPERKALIDALRRGVANARARH